MMKGEQIDKIQDYAAGDNINCYSSQAFARPAAPEQSRPGAAAVGFTRKNRFSASTLSFG
jgi:hypothetical protein